MVRSQAGLNGKATGQTSGDAQLSCLPGPPQGAAEQEVAVQLQPMQLLGHRRRAADAPGRQGPFRIRVADAASIGLALFLSLFVMAPVLGRIHDDAVQPYLDGKLAFQPAVTAAEKPLRAFMLAQTREADLLTFTRLSGRDEPYTEASEVPFRVLAASFLTSELTTAFQIHGHDDAVADADQPAVQADAVRDGRRLVADAVDARGVLQGRRRMSPEQVLPLAREALLLTLMLAAPLLIASLAVGVLVGLFQAATQINEMTLSFIPKLMALAAVVVIAGPWMLQTLTEYTRRLFESIPGLVG